MTNYRYILVILQLVSVFFGTLATNLSDVPGSNSFMEKPAWFKYAKEYLEANEQMQASRGKANDTLWRYFLISNEAMKKFLECPQPSALEINMYLKSDKYFEKKVGLAAMSLRPIENKMVVEQLIRFLGSEDRDSRIYASLALKKMNPESYAFYESQIYQYSLREKDETVLMSEILILGILNNPRYLPLFVKFLQGDSITLRLSAYNALKIMGEAYLDEVIDSLKEKKDFETIDFIYKLESGDRSPLKYRRYERSGN